VQHAALRLEANWEYVSPSVEVWYVLSTLFASLIKIYIPSFIICSKQFSLCNF